MSQRGECYTKWAKWGKCGTGSKSQTKMLHENGKEKKTEENGQCNCV